MEIQVADLSDPIHASAILELLDLYSQDKIITGKPLSEDVQQKLIPSMQAHPGTYVFLAFVEGKAVGLAICFIGFSTFRASRLLNIHDLSVHPSFRGQGIGRALLNRVEETAKELGCCKLTLEVSQENSLARSLYVDFGFASSKDEATTFNFLSKDI